MSGHMHIVSMTPVLHLHHNLNAKISFRDIFIVVEVKTSAAVYCQELYAHKL